MKILVLLGGVMAMIAISEATGDVGYVVGWCAGIIAMMVYDD